MRIERHSFSLMSFQSPCCMFALQENTCPQGRNLFRGFWFSLCLQTWKSLLAEMEALRGTFSPSLDVESGPSDAFMECLRNWYASSNESMGMTRPSTEFFDENGIHTPRSPKLTPSSFLLGNQQEENQAREILEQEIGESSSPLEYGLKSEALDIRGTSKGSWDSTYMELLESFKNEIFLPESLASIAGNVSTWNKVDGQLTAGSGGQFEDTAEQSKLDEFDIMVDLLCPRCDNLLYRPIVLNCGHGTCPVSKCIFSSSC